jgi:acyl transferase domain-containing protein
METGVPEGIAIVAVAGRFPGAGTPEALWRLLLDEREGITFFTGDELRAAGVPEHVLADPDYVRAAGVLRGVEQFDAGFFGMTPAEAALTPPEHRLFLECAWEALERCGHTARGRRVGVFGGTGFNGYLLQNVWPAVQAGTRGFFPMVLANAADHLAARVAYRLDLRGPAISVQAACSTSLVAVHQACQSLLTGECELALAGGASVGVPLDHGYLYEEGGILSPDGRCRPFDARAQGTVPSSGVALVALRRVEDALADGDPILAVIRGSAVNNDGAGKMGYAAPSVDGQAAVIAEALAVSGVDPATVGYVEGHSTGTALGDPMEVAALTRVYGAAPRGGPRIRIGSAKASLGHTDTAAGVTGLIKAVLSLHHRRIVATPHFQAPNPAIDFAATPFQVADEGLEWTAEGAAPRRAGVSSFGMGGTNVHVVIEEAPRVPAQPARRPWQLLTLSARTDAALAQARAELAAHLRTEDVPLADAAYTLQAGRQGFAVRCAVVAADAESAAAALEGGAGVVSGRAGPSAPPVAFLFPGEGAQYPGMGRGLYETEPAYRAAIDRCAALLRPHVGEDLRALLHPAPGGGDAAAERLRSTTIAQPALFATAYATAMLWMEWGVRPAAMLGHGIGEYAAACLAGVFALEDAVSLVAARGRLMQALPRGAMLSVALPVDEARALLGDGLAVAGDDAPDRCVVSGTEAAVAALEARLAGTEVRHARLDTPHALHSPMMDPVLDEFTALVARVPRRAPELPWISNVTGTWITVDEARDPAYWARHLRRTVRFREGARTLLALPDVVMLEVGPGRSLSALIEAQEGAADARRVASMRQPGEAADDVAFIQRALGSLWAEGVEADWSGVWKHERRRRVRLPTYPFQRSRHWIDAPAGTPAAPEAAAALPASATAETVPLEALEALISGQIQLMSRQARLLAAAGDAAADEGAPRQAGS